MKITLYPKYLVRSLFVHDSGGFFKFGYKLLYPEYSRHGMTPWQHYVIDGKRKGFGNGTHPSDAIFFPEGYELEYPDVKAAGVDPWRHYAEKGVAEGRDNGLHPNGAMFFAEGYLEMYPDVAQSGMDPWHHYVLKGKAEGRDNGLHPNGSIFFAAGYLEMYPDAAKSGMDPWRHYVLKGKAEGRDNGWHPGNDLFFSEGYLDMYRDIAKAGVEPWFHYVRHGKSEGRNNGLNDYSILLSGHKKEILKAVYLSPCKSFRVVHSKKALLIGHEFSVSGAPLSLLGIAKILIDQGYGVDIAVRDLGRPVPVNLYDGIGADVYLLPCSTECFPNADRIVKNYDLVIVNTIVMGAYAELCRNLNIPHIWFVREDLPTIHYFSRIIDGIGQKFLDDYENVVCVSKYVTDCIYAEFKIKYKYINNFIEDRVQIGNIKKLKNNRLDNRMVTFAVVAGTVERRKAHETVISAVLSLSANPKYKGRWKLFLIGKCGKNASDPKLGMKLLSVTKGIKDIVWVGQVADDKWELFDKIDFFIVPSLEEASSRVAIEAAMLGKPVIATTHVGAKYLTNDNAGFLYEPGNAAELRKIIIRCLDMAPSEYETMSCQIRLNYDKTSSRTVYSKSLHAAIDEAVDRTQSNSLLDKSPEYTDMSLRTMSAGRNVVLLNRLEYIKFADFARLEGGIKSVSDLAEQNHFSGIVVPVFNGVDFLKVLMPSLFSNTDLPHLFIFVNDCSNKETSDFLEEMIRGRDDCILLNNEQNLGFVKSINKGAAKALESCDNFVMLNSDTEVPSGWLSRLMKPIFDDEKISSVTPRSNRCNIFSFPFFDKRERNDIFLEKFGLEGINSAIRNSAVDRYIELPTGHGFCMAISGKAWKMIGGLNEALFGRGFGEENEWSLRAELDGFRNVLLPELYVAHHEKGSFSSEEKKANCAAAQDIISVMFPSYRPRVRNFIREYPTSDSIVSIYISLARQKGLKAEIFTDSSSFMTRLSGDDGIFVLNTQGVTRLAVKLLGETIFVGNARNIEKTGIYNS